MRKPELYSVRKPEFYSVRKPEFSSRSNNRCAPETDSNEHGFSKTAEPFYIGPSNRLGMERIVQMIPNLSGHRAELDECASGLFRSDTYYREITFFALTVVAFGARNGRDVHGLFVSNFCQQHRTAPTTPRKSNRTAAQSGRRGSAQRCRLTDSRLRRHRSHMYPPHK